MAAGTFDYTAKLAARLLRDEHGPQADASATGRRMREAQAKHPRAHVYFDPEINDVVIDLSSGGR